MLVLEVVRGDVIDVGGDLVKLTGVKGKLKIGIDAPPELRIEHHRIERRPPRRHRIPKSRLTPQPARQQPDDSDDGPTFGRNFPTAMVLLIAITFGFLAGRYGWHDAPDNATASPPLASIQSDRHAGGVRLVTLRRSDNSMNLRAFNPTTSDDNGPADVSIRDAFLTYLLPTIAGRRAKKTTSAYFTAIRHWESFIDAAGENGSTVSTPVAVKFTHVAPTDTVSQITDEVLNDFGLWLVADDHPSPGLSIDTAGQQWKKLRTILRRMGPRESGNPRALGHIERVPVMDPLGELGDPVGDDDGPVDITDDQLAAIYHACDLASWPPGPNPALQWKTFLVIASVMGPRVNDAATLQAANFRLDPSSPVVTSRRTYADGWLVYRPTKTGRKKPARLIVPLPVCVRSHVAELRRGDGQLFTWSNSKSKSFARQWQQIVDQAGTPHIERRNLRSLANIRWDRASEKDLGRWVLGHAARDVNDRHYMRAEPDLIEAAPLVEVPAAFNASLTDTSVQTFLF